ncbi:MAG TPA: glycine betaine ABC transporter substrate-binding protein [Thermoanaerobaculia bacterium]|nr:glycine betaine ABC transporter substrate-binding protein [Thermoanaerobaculia bacterium]
MMRRLRIGMTLLFIAAALAGCREGAPSSIVVGSKNFTESVILGELVAQRLEAAGCRVDRRLNLGGTLVCDRAIAGGSLDVYVEYSGTALTAILGEPTSSDREAVNRTIRQRYRARGLHWGPGLGFDNTFAMLVRRSDSERLGLRSIGDLHRVADRFQAGFGYEFTERPDGWPGLQQAYGFRFAKPPITMDLGLTYKALASGRVDLIAGNSTDGLIETLGLHQLEDDRHYFPPYEAAVVARRDIERKCPSARAALDSLAAIFDDAAMRRLNEQVDRRVKSEREVAGEMLRLQ